MDLDINVYDDILVQEFAQANKENYLAFSLPLIIQTVTIADSGPTMARGAYLTWNKDVNITLVDEVTIFKQGTGTHGSGSMRIIPADGFTTGKMCWKAFSSVQDFSPYDKISFWIRTEGIAISMNTIKIQLCSDTAGNTPVDEFTIDIVLYNGRWNVITLPRTGGGMLSASIQSVVIYALLDPGTNNYYFDNLIACKDLTLSSLVGKNVSGELYWFPLKSINGTALEIGAQDDQGATAGPTWPCNKPYFGTAEVTTCYAREPIVTRQHIATASSFAVQTVNQNGDNSGTRITGGYNPATGIRDGETFFDGVNGWGYALSFSYKDYIILQRLGFVRYYYGMQYYAQLNGFGMDQIWLCGNSYYGIYAYNCGRSNYGDIYAMSNKQNGISIDFKHSIANKFVSIGCQGDGVQFKDGSYDVTVRKIISCGNGASGFYLSANTGMKILDLETRYNNTAGIYSTYAGVNFVNKAVIKNNTWGVYSSYTNANLTILEGYFRYNVTQDIQMGQQARITLINCEFPDGIKQNITTYDSDPENTALVILNNKTTGQEFWQGNYGGIIQSDTVNYRTASPCISMRPINSLFLTTLWGSADSPIVARFPCPADSGQARTMSIWVKISGDLTIYRARIGVRYKGEIDYLGVGKVDISDFIDTTYRKVEITIPSGSITKYGILEFCVLVESNGTGSLYADDFEWS